jgi:NAD(P)-dependent dehydrogenase (short-subunit alcohol dehydrogenase family)
VETIEPRHQPTASEAVRRADGEHAGRSRRGRAAPSDIAPAYLYSMESDFTTGETIHIDGGQRLI